MVRYHCPINRLKLIFCCFPPRFYQMFDEVPMAECFAKTGQPPISTRWVGVNKGDKEHPDVRYRWVARQF